MNKLTKRTVLGFLLASVSAFAARPVLNTSAATSRTGHFQLSWRYDEIETTFTLQQASTPAFDQPVTIYQGPDRARTVSGLLNGEYYYRVGTEANEWSDPVSVHVEHYELRTAFTFLGLGAIVFIATAILIIRGHLSHRSANRKLSNERTA